MRDRELRRWAQQVPDANVALQTSRRTRAKAWAMGGADPKHGVLVYVYIYIYYMLLNLYLYMYMHIDISVCNDL